MLAFLEQVFYNINVDYRKYCLFLCPKNRLLLAINYYLLGGNVMYETELRCPHCQKLVGKTNASEKSIAKVLKVAPKTKQLKKTTFQNKCPKCNNLIYIVLGFMD